MSARRDLTIVGGAALAAIGLAFVLTPRRKGGPFGGCDVKLLGMFTRPVEQYAPFEAVTTCDPEPKPGAMAFRDWALDALGGTDEGIRRECNVGGSSKHHEGRAWDWGIPNPATAAQFVACLTTTDADGQPDALARRAGLRTIIYERMIWKAGSGWNPYTKLGADPHTTHVHFGFGWEGARGKTSLYELLESGNVVPTQDIELVIGNGSTIEIRELLAVPGLADNTSEEFKQKAIELADAMDISPSLWLAVMSFETGGTFDPAQPNLAGSGAVGLIQFTKKYAPLIVGKTTAELAEMSAVEQLDYVDTWYRHNDAYKRIEYERDYYLTVFAPAGVGQELGFPLYLSPSKAYEQNAAMDLDGDGVITVGDVSAKFRAFVKAAEQRRPVVVTMRSSGREGAALVVALALAVAATAAVVG